MDSSDPPEYAVRQTELGMLPMGAKVGRVQPGKCEQVPDQFEHFVHALTTSLCLNLGSDVPVLDHHAADAAVS